MTAVFLVSGFSLSEGFNAQGVLFLILGVVALACLDFSVRVYGKNERTVALTFYSMLFTGTIFFIFSINNFNNILLKDFLIMVSATTPKIKNKTPCALKPSDKLNPETKKTCLLYTSPSPRD